MNFKSIYYYLKGCVTICASGPFCERLLNICMHRGLTVRDIKHCGTEQVIFTTDIPSYHLMRTPAYRTKSHVRILKRRGLPFLLSRYKNRRLSICGIILLLVMLWYASNHVMGITIFGNNRIDTEFIRSSLAECGLVLGMKTSDISPDILRGRMMQKSDELAWIGINANGSRVYIEIVERTEKENGIGKDGIAQNLIASKDGEIEKIQVKEGQTAVTIGSGVRKGDMLVSGIIDNDISGFRYVKARGEVYARTAYSKTRSYPIKYEENIKTGKTKKHITVSIMNFNLPLFFGSNPSFEIFTEDENVSEYKPPIDMLPSVFVKAQTFYEEQITQKTRTVQDTVTFGGEELYNELEAELDDAAEIIEKNESYTINERGEVELTVSIICRENIAVPEVISHE